MADANEHKPMDVSVARLGPTDPNERILFILLHVAPHLSS